MKDWFIATILMTGFIIGLGYMYRDSQRLMRRYEIEHNCRYDYNDLCYTREQKPWLFE